MSIEAVCLRINDSSDVSEARQTAVRMAYRVGFNETDVGNIAIAATEAAGNLVKHAPDGGNLLLLPGEDGTQTLTMLSLDRGPGMENPTLCLQDGYSTAGSPGTGLGAIKRLAKEFDLYSGVPSGTALLARFEVPKRRNALEGRSRKLEVGGVSVPIAGEQACGDAWDFRATPEGGLILVADGLGHGVAAAQASKLAVEIFREEKEDNPEILLEVMHCALRSTRGAAISIAEVNLAKGVVRYAGIGNVSGVILDGRSSRSMVSMNGTVGHVSRRIKLFQYPWNPDSLLVMHSDGIASQWKLDDYSGLGLREPTVVAGVIYRDFGRSRDDVTVVAARQKRYTQE